MLAKAGFNLSAYTNPLASIHTILKRLAERRRGHHQHERWAGVLSLESGRASNRDRASTGKSDGLGLQIQTAQDTIQVSASVDPEFQRVVTSHSPADGGVREGCFEGMRNFRGMVSVALLAGLVFGTGCETDHPKPAAASLPAQAKAPEIAGPVAPPADPQAQSPAPGE